MKKNIPWILQANNNKMDLSVDRAEKSNGQGQQGS